MQVVQAKVHPSADVLSEDDPNYSPRPEETISMKNQFVTPEEKKKETKMVQFKEMIWDATESVERAALWVAFKLGMSDDRSYSFERYQQKVFRDKIVEEQTRQHGDKKRLYFWIRQKALAEVRDMLKENPKLIYDRDCAGATPIHSAYLFEHYEIAHWLVERFPEVALKPYVGRIDPNIAKDLPEGSYSERYMPYTGENILHMVIVRRNHEEVRWILDFFNDHKHVVPGGLSKLLTSNATGMFFEKEGDFYFGGYPLHFAVCSNDTAIFDLVLSFASCVDLSQTGQEAHKPTPPTSEKRNSLGNLIGLNSSSQDEMNTDNRSESRKTSGDTHFGSNVIFMRDNYGNTCLHLCVLHCLDKMYSHVYKVAQSIVERELKIHFSKESVKKTAIPGKTVIKMFPYDIANVVENDHNGHSVVPRVVYLPHQDHLTEWVTKEAHVKLEERLVLALNRDLHSPLTLAASQVMSTADEINDIEKELNTKRIAMLTFLLSHLKQILWEFGPIRCSLLNLDGVEIRYDRNLYPGIPSKKSSIWDFIYWKFLKVVCWKTQKFNGMFSAIEWLCTKDADRAIIIPEIQKIIQIKWERFGYPKFLVSMAINGMVCILITLVLAFINATPTSKPNFGSEVAVDILYPILVIMFFCMFCAEMHYIYCHPYSYFQARGVVKFSRRCRWLKIISFAVFCSLKTQLSYAGYANSYEHGADDNGLYNPQDYMGIKISLTSCVLFSWIHMYYFLMGFDKTGPFILTIFRIVSKDVPYFLKFYSIVVIAFACVLSMLGNQGNPKSYYGFWILIQATYTLIQNTVGTSPTHDTTGLDLVPNDLNWLSDILLTSYSFVVVLIMLNLLIAMINNTYALYTTYNESLLLMEKYNIMHAFELAMTREELKVYRAKFAIIQPSQDEEEDSHFAKGDNDDDDFPEAPASMLQTVSKSVSNLLSGPEKPKKKAAVDRYTFEMQDEMHEWWDNEKATKAKEQPEVAPISQQEIIDAVLSAMQIQHQASMENLMCLLKDGSVVTPNGTKVYNDSRPNSSPKLSLTSPLLSSSAAAAVASAAAATSTAVVPTKTVLKSSTMSTLFIIDPQVDFHPIGGPLNAQGEFDKTSPLFHHGGTLAVGGANEDSQRIADMINENYKNIREIFVSMDSHYPTHIAHAISWKNEKGEHPAPFTAIMHADVKSKKWIPTDPANEKWALEYTNMLERKGRMVLTIWPQHCIVGSRGHAVVPVINEALKKWAHHSGRSINYIMKGQNCRTEMYSAIEAEVEDPLDSSTGLNSELVDILKISDQLIVCGEAMSHCVNYTVRDIVKHWHGDLSKIVILRDGASPVAGFEKAADEFLAWAKENKLTISTCGEVFNAAPI